MFDIRWIRENAAAFDAGLRRRGIEPGGDVKFSSELLEIDEARRRVTTELQEKQARRNAASKEIGKAKGAKDEVTAQKLMAEVAALKDALEAGEKEQKQRDEELRAALSVIPNIPLDEVPEGKDEHGNKLIRTVGEPPKLGGMNKPRQHFEIGEMLGLMDFDTAAKLSGARFVVLKGQLARLERALGAFMLDLHTTKFGYTEIAPPMMVRDEVMYGTAQLPKFEDDQFETSRKKAMYQVLEDFFASPHGHMLEERVHSLLIEKGQQVQKTVEMEFTKQMNEFRLTYSDRERLWLIPTAEVPLTNLVREKITDEAE